MCDSPELLHALERLTKAVEGQYKRGYEDTTYQVSDTQGFVLDYRGYRYLFVYSETALTFKLGASSYAIAANQWTLLAFKEGFKIFTSGQATPVGIRVRAIDDLMALAGAITQGTSPWVVSVSNGNPNGQTTMANSSPVAIASDQSAIPIGVATTGGSTPYHNLSANSTNFTNVKTAAAQMYGYALSNTSGAAIYVKFYDKATAPGTGDTPKHTVQVPANGAVVRAIPEGMKFTTGFGWAATGAVADNDNTSIAANCVIDFDLNS